ncbi:MAG: class I mannose-6-phosphate isomerase [Acidobacteriales bacterium]|nr:class I mannose-6-phosphate isomerase [Terriglobales bacterium]
MSELYPLLMRPLFDPRPWGSVDLTPIYPNHRFEEKIGEAWLTGDHCRVANGQLAGKTLGELTVGYGRELVGTAPENAMQFPLLMKFLFPHEKLSVQVHPDDASAKAAELPCGKTECWYVAHAQPGAKLALGLRPGVAKPEFEQGIHQQRAEELLNWINVFPGEMIYVAGGTVHTIGPGMVLVETQQQSDTTYRLYDYGRGRELHLEAGMAAVKEHVASGKVIRPASVNKNGGKNVHSQLIAAPYFKVDMFELKEIQDFGPQTGKTSAQILLAVEGCGVVEAENSESVTLAKGDAVVVPAAIENFRIRPQWSVELLRAQVPPVSVPEPATRM